MSVDITDILMNEDETMGDEMLLQLLLENTNSWSNILLKSYTPRGGI